MESLELRIFKEVASTKSITKTAENMGYVQSNITAHIKKLEAELDTSLLIHHNKGVTLTADGEKLLYQAEKIISLLDKTSHSFKTTTKSLNIGATQTIVGYLLPQCLIEFQKMFPNISISVQTYEQKTLNMKFSNGQLDCILSNSPYAVSIGKHILQYPEELMLVTPDFCESIDEIEQFPLIINNIESCPYRKALLNWWHSRYSGLPKTVEMDTVEAILNTVARGGGISLLPKNTLQGKLSINYFHVEELQSTSVHMWVSKNKLLPEYSALREIIKKQFKNNNQDRYFIV